MRQRRHKARLLRLTASLMAITGLLGHGLAMLLVSLLALSPAPPASAQDGFPGVVEICAADGLIKVIANPPAGEAGSKDSEDPRAPASGKIDACPVCTAFAQSGHADLPVLAVLAGRAARPDLPRPGHQVAAPTPGLLLAQSRAPPAA